jgi:hypothetical protein
MGKINVEVKNLICMKYGSVAAFAKHICWHSSKLYKILNGKQIPYINEVEFIADSLEEDRGKMLYIFANQWS